jgi:hypothetical protein
MIEMDAVDKIYKFTCFLIELRDRINKSMPSKGIEREIILMYLSEVK